MIPKIYTPDDIVAILENGLVDYRRLSGNMYWFGIGQDYQIGSIALSQNELRCRFHYNDGDKTYTNTFIYDQDAFMREIDKAKQAYRHKKQVELQLELDVLETLTK